MKAYIQQKHSLTDKLCLQALVPFSVLKDSVLFTCKATPGAEEDGEETYKDRSHANVLYYQRRIEPKRLNDLQKYIMTSVLDERDYGIINALFPSSMILALNNDYNSVKELNDNECEITLDENVFIVDGQHRMMAMLNLYEQLSKDVSTKTDDVAYLLNFIENYKFSCTILVNYDLWEQGQVFINVNFRHKPVNKSLYYEVFGSEYREEKTDWKRNQIYIAHCLVQELNSLQKSPFCGHIKMLGTGKGYVSQAFFVESILQLFRPEHIWNIDTDSKDFDVSQISYYLTEILTYFVAVRDTFINYWPQADSEKGSIVCKTTGVGAFVRFMELMRSEDDAELIKQLKDTPKGEICVSYYNSVMKIMAPLKNKAHIVFGEHSAFNSASGKGAEMRLFKWLRRHACMEYRAELLLNRIRIYMPDNRITIIDADDIHEDLQRNLWAYEVEELMIAHHYDIEDISNMKIESVAITEDGIACRVSYTTNVYIFLDNEDKKGHLYHLPSHSQLYYRFEQGRWKFMDSDVDNQFDTSLFQY